MKTKNGNSGVMDAFVKQQVTNLLYKIRTFINASGMVFGAIILHILDVVLGGLVLSRVLENSIQFDLFGIPISGAIIGWMLSIVFWYVQLLLWDAVLEDGKITLKDIPAIVLSIIIAIIDTFGDSSAILIGTKDSALKEYLQGVTFYQFGNLFDILATSLFWATMLVTGFNEFLNGLLVRNANVMFDKPKKKYNTSRKKKSLPKQGDRNIDRILQQFRSKNP